MATYFRVVIPADMGSSIKLGVKEPNKYDVDLSQLDLPAGLTGLSLQGTVLTATTSDGPVTVDLAPMLPTVTADGNGLVAVKIYKDLIVTHGVLTVDNQGRFVTKDALVALKQPSKRNIGQMNLMTADEYGSTTNSRHYRLSFNFYNAQPVIKAISLTLNRWNGGEHIEPVKWVDYDGQEVTPNGVTTQYDNDQLIINITDLNEFRNSNADLVFKHWDEYRDYDGNYSSFYDEVRQGLDSGRWSFNPTVDTSLVDYPDSDTYELLNSAFTFNVYG